MKKKITKTLIESESAPQNSKLLIWDETVSGFHVVIRPSGRKSFYAFYRLRNHKQQTVKLGDFPAMTVEEAREKCKALMNQAFDGVDPLAVIRERARLEEPDPAKNGTMRDLYAKYMAEHAIFKKPASRKNDVIYWERHILPRIGDKRVREVTRGDISAIHKGIGAELNRKGELMKTTANRVLEVLKKAFSLAEEWEWRPEGSNPGARIKKFKEQARNRYLTLQEAAALDKVLAKYLDAGYRERQVARLVLILLLVGGRKQEIRNARWEWVNLERGVLSLPDSKSNEPQDIQLPDKVLDILADIREDQRRNNRESDYIFDGHVRGQPLKDEGKHWDNIRAEAGLKDFRMHDLRHSFASYMAMATGSELMIQQSLRHADAKTSKRYTHMFNEPLRSAVNQTAGKIIEAMRGDKIVDFETAKQARRKANDRGQVSEQTA